MTHIIKSLENHKSKNNLSTVADESPQRLSILFKFLYFYIYFYIYFLCLRKEDSPVCERKTALSAKGRQPCLRKEDSPQRNLDLVRSASRYVHELIKARYLESQMDMVDGMRKLFIKK